MRDLWLHVRSIPRISRKFLVGKNRGGSGIPWGHRDIPVSFSGATGKTRGIFGGVLWMNVASPWQALHHSAVLDLFLPFFGASAPFPFCSFARARFNSNNLASSSSSDSESGQP